jgi:hypothetical protein
MSAVSAAPLPPRPSPGSRLRVASLALLAAVVVLLGLLSGLPYGVGIVVAIVGVASAVVLRLVSSPTVTACAPIPVLLAMVMVATTAPISFGAELLAGFSGLAFLVWLADDPSRPAGGAVRGLSVAALPALALGIAWSSALFLPAGSVPLGVAGGLLALAVAALALLFGAPGLFEREEARS